MFRTLHLSGETLQKDSGNVHLCFMTYHSPGSEQSPFTKSTACQAKTFLNITSLPKATFKRREAKKSESAVPRTPALQTPVSRHCATFPGCGHPQSLYTNCLPSLCLTSSAGDILNAFYCRPSNIFTKLSGRMTLSIARAPANSGAISPSPKPAMPHPMRVT